MLFRSAFYFCSNLGQDSHAASLIIHLKNVFVNIKDQDRLLLLPLSLSMMGGRLFELSYVACHMSTWSSVLIDPTPGYFAQHEAACEWYERI